MEALVAAAACVAILSAPALIWHIRGPFLGLNWLQWTLMAPWRPLVRDVDGVAAHRWFRRLLPLWLAYGFVAYLVLAPLRLVNAIYFDLALFWTVALRDGLADVMFPSYPGRRGRDYVISWVTRLPVRLASVFVRCSLALLQGLIMAAFDLIWPTVTLFHGTEFYDLPLGLSPAKDIVRFNRWMIGPRCHLGTGIYFGLWERVARHYARNCAVPAVVVARVSLDPSRAEITLPAGIRSQIGHNGRAINEQLGFPWASLEFWRSDLSTHWYELCLLLHQAAEPVRTWRVRPICVIVRGVPQRVPGGPAHWPGTLAAAWTILLPSLLAVLWVAAACWREHVSPWAP